MPTPRVRLRHAALFAAALLMLGPRVVALPSGAVLTGSTTSPGNEFSAGSVELTMNPSNALLAATGLKPGDSQSGSLVVVQSGTLLLRYAMVTTVTNPDGKGLAGQLQLGVREVGSSCATFDGLELYNGPLMSAAIGNPAKGPQAGDRQLAAATSETLCFKVSLPVSTPISYESATTVATFTFSAEQTAANS